MRAVHALSAIALAAALAPPAPAAEGEERRGSVPPGTSQDGSRPNEGAIVGGSIEARKRAGDARKGRQDVERCRDLEGTLRDQCIADARESKSRGVPR
jgi:hypothetical protein